MTVDLNPFPNLNVPPAAALWPPRPDRRDTRPREEIREADRPEHERAAPLTGWPRVFPGL
jgi:hypothetical protein